MREIGSEFWDVRPIGKGNGFFMESAQWFLSGRVALMSIIQELKGCHDVAIPSWCCDSMIKPFLEAGIKVHFYPIYWDHGLIQDLDYNCDILLLMDYFGYTGDAPDLTGYKGIVIRDVTHSIFSAVYSDADYYFGSLRKWCGLWTGGFAWTKDGHNLIRGTASDQGYVYLRDKAMSLKSAYIKDNKVADKGYLAIFQEAEDILENVDLAPANERDVLLASKLDVNSIRCRRRLNAEILRNAFPDWLLFPEMSENDCPLFVPVLVPGGKRDALRNHLISQEIYFPIHWPISEYHQLNNRADYVYKNELSLVCDQRYKEPDMLRIIESINIFMKEF